MATIEARTGKCVAGVLILCALLSSVFAEEVVQEKVRLKRVTGKVELHSPKGTKWRQGKPGTVLTTGWEIRTKGESMAELEFETGTIVRVGENSMVELSTLQYNKSVNATRSNVKLGKGQLWSNVKALTDNRSRFVFETPTATAAIRGTRLRLEARRGRTTLDVYDGLVQVRKVGSTKPVTVMSRTRAVIDFDDEQIRLYRFSAKSAKDPSIDPKLKGQDPMIDPFIDGAEEPADEPSGKGTGDLKLEIMYPKDKQVMAEADAVVTAQTVAGAVAYIGDKQAAVGADGLFSDVVKLKPGVNTIRVSAALGRKTADKSIQVNFQTPLYLEIKNVTDGMKVLSREFVLDIEVTKGAKFSVNGVEGQTRVRLASGTNTIRVRAWDEQGGTAEKVVRIVYRSGVKATLYVSSPQEGATVQRPEVSVAGTATPGAKVTVNNIPMSLDASGSFGATIPFPDEPGEYVLVAKAQIGDEETVVERTVKYTPPKTPLVLTVTSPAEGQVITRRVLSVTGMTSAHATLTVNSEPVRVSAAGLFSTEIPLSERDIGDFSLEIVATDPDGGTIKTINVVVDPTSPQINTSPPRVEFQGQLVKATRNRTVTVQATDHTPEDEISVVFASNGSKEEYLLESGETEEIELHEGKNVYTLYAFDKAGNMSNTLEGVIYYLPGPLKIEIVEPLDNPHVIRGLPPMPVSQVGRPRLELEIEIDDGVDEVPETILYCRVRGNGQSILLHNNNDYTFTGDVELTVGQPNTFTIEVEDLAGTVQKEFLTVFFSR